MMAEGESALLQMILNTSIPASSRPPVYTPRTPSPPSLPSPGCGPPVLGSLLYLAVWGTLLLAVLSLLLNTLAVTVYRPLHRHAWSRYLLLSSAADALILLLSLAGRWGTMLDYVTDYVTWTSAFDHNVVICKTVTFMTYACVFVSSWSTVALCRERSIVVSTPHRLSGYQTPGVATRMCGLIILASVIVNLPVIVTWTVTSSASLVSPELCTSAGNDLISGSQVALIETVLVLVVPMVFIVLYTAYLAKNVKEWRLQRRRMCSNALVRMRYERQACVMILANLYCHCACAVPYIFIQSFLFTWEFTHAHWTVCEVHIIGVVRFGSQVALLSAHTFKFFTSILTGKYLLNPR